MACCFISCYNPPTNITRAELEVKKQMENPASFQVIKSEILDTMMQSEQWAYMIATDSTIITNRLREIKEYEHSDKPSSKENIKSCEEVVKWFRINIQDVLSQIKEHKPDSIYYIAYKVNYCSKNSLEILDTGSSEVRYYPRRSKFEIQDPRWVISLSPTPFNLSWVESFFVNQAVEIDKLKQGNKEWPSGKTGINCICHNDSNDYRAAYLYMK